MINLLRNKGFRATKPRIALLTILERVGHPLSVKDILCEWQDLKYDQATLYRSLSDLTEAGIIRRVELNTKASYFEYAPDRPHHHHLVCTGCQRVEEVEICSLNELEKKILRHSAQFNKILRHNLEFFGECKICTAQA